MAQRGNKKRKNANYDNDHEIFGVVLILVSAVLLLCLVIPPVLGVVSRTVFSFMLGAFGFAVYPVLTALLTWGILIMKRRTERPGKRGVCIGLIALFLFFILQLATTHSFLRETYSQYISNVYDIKYSAGGVVLGTLAFGLKSVITEIGCYILFSVLIVGVVLYLVDIVGIIKNARKKKRKEEPQEPPAPVRVGALNVIAVEPKNELFTGVIKRTQAIQSESGMASDIPQSSKRVFTDYSDSPIIDKRDDREPMRDKSQGDVANSVAYSMLYGGSSDINKIEIEEFYRQEEGGAYREQNTANNSGYSVMDPAQRVSHDAALNNANKPKKIEHDNSGYGVFFPVEKTVELNDDGIENADEIKAKLQRDAERRRQLEMDSINNRSYQPEQQSRGATFSAPGSGLRIQPEIVDFTPIEQEDIIDASDRNGAVNTQALTTPHELSSVFGTATAESGAPVENTFGTASDPGDTDFSGGYEQEDIIDAHAVRDLYAPETDDDEGQPRRDDIIVGSAQPQPRKIVSSNLLNDEIIRSDKSANNVSDADDGGIINASAGGGSLIISDEPVRDLSETHDTTKDLIDNTDMSGMYVAAGSEKSKVKKQKGGAPLDNQITIDAVLKEKADESVVLANTKRHKKYRFAPPPIDLLKLHSKAETSSEELRETAKKLEEVVSGFLKSPVSVISIVPGPTVTRYELELQSGVPVKQIETHSSDIEYELATSGHIRIEAPIPGKRAVGIEIPNRKTSIVGLREILESSEFEKAKSPMTVSVGKDISGGVVLCDLEKVPHLLIAGQTGSGKSACLNGLIVSLLYKSSPEDLRFILVDPKQVEFSAYRGMPHLLFNNIIYEPNEVLNALKWACNEMERRYALLSKYGCNRLASFNALPDVANGSIDKLPHIIIIIDELADIMQSAVKREIEDGIKKIAAKARAAGIHLIVATQRPSADVITGTIKTNLTSRIAFKVSGQLESRIILDTPGAEALVGHGDMLFYPVDYTDPRRVQGSYIEENEVAAVICDIKERYECDFDDDAERYVFNSGKGGASGGGDMSNSDPLLPDIVALAVKSKQISTSTVQRRFAIGYARAARIIDLMEEAGYIGPSPGNSKPRETYLTAEQYREIFGRDVEDS